MSSSNKKLTRGDYPGVVELTEHLAHIVGLPKDKARRITYEMTNWMGISLIQCGGFYLPRIGRVVVKKVVVSKFGPYAVLEIKPSRTLASLAGFCLEEAVSTYYASCVDELDEEPCPDLKIEHITDESVLDNEYIEEDEDEVSEDCYGDDLE